tara:strand:- start:77 stop:997 length:921 start_codon:yes stop_codon:yes gene_type:complete
MELIKGDCLEVLKTLKDKSIDFVYLDLPYGQTACKWDNKLDLKELWIELKRIAKNDRTPFFFSCTTKFGFEIFNNSPKGYFRWDLVWKKNRGTGFLNAYKLPMRKHEMIYCFAKKSPEYDVSSHNKYKEEKEINVDSELWGKKNNLVKAKRHKDPLPTSDVTPPTEDHELVYCFAKKSPEYDVSSHKEDGLNDGQYERPITCYGYNKDKINVIKPKSYKNPLPNSDITPSSWCEYNTDQKTGHRTAKPVALMEFLLKYWTKEGWTVLDPTMGSGSMGIACKNMKRKFIGIEKDDLIYELARTRILG